MTLEQQIAVTRRVLAVAQTFRATLDHVEGDAKTDLQAQADATVAKVTGALRELEAMAAISTETLQ